MGLKNLANLPSCFDYIFVHPGQKARLKPELSLKFCQLKPEPDPKSPPRLTTLIWGTSLLPQVVLYSSRN